jgi:hypothetical protein
MGAAAAKETDGRQTCLHIVHAQGQASLTRAPASQSPGRDPPPYRDTLPGWQNAVADGA